MKQSLHINLIPFELSFEKIKVYYSEELKNGYDLMPKGLINPSAEPNEKICWSLNKFNNNSKEIEIEKNSREHFRALNNIFKKAFHNYFLSQNLIVCNDFIGSFTLLEKISSRVPNLTRYKKFTVRIFHPKQQYILYKGNVWCLSICYDGETEVTENPLSFYDEHSFIKKVFVKNKKIEKLNKLTEDEKKSPETKIIINRQFCQKQNLPINFYKSENKYKNFYNEILGFYSKYIKGENINIEGNKSISLFESGFQKISENQVMHTKQNSNLLIFGENSTHYNPYWGIKEYGPHQSITDGQYKFFFIFHEDDKEVANTLHAYLTKGSRGFPGLFRFVGLNLDIDKSKTIRFRNENPIQEIEQKLNSPNFDNTKITKYLGIYISRIKKDDPDPEKIKIYHQLKKILLEKNITSQVIHKDNIIKTDFNYYLPNIAIAILAKLGGVPWRLKRPIEHDLIIGVGAFRQNQNTYIGTTITFKNDGTFVQFESSQANSIEDISNFLKTIILQIPKKINTIEVKRVIIHYYKEMNKQETKVVESHLNNLGLKIPYIVLHITESNNFIPFDTSYNGKMPVSGTCIVIKNGSYLLCNNERYLNTAGAKIKDFPYPVQITISKTNKEHLAKKDIEPLIDQAYQFSRMYWKAVKQKEKPVTVLYSEIIAEFSSFFSNNTLPDSDIAKKTLWFL